MNSQLPLRFPLDRSITIIGTCTPNKIAKAKKQPEGNWKMHVKIFCILLTEHEASIIVCSSFREAAAVGIMYKMCHGNKISSNCTQPAHKKQ